MKRFTVILATAGIAFWVAALAIHVLPFDPQSLGAFITSDGTLDPLALHAFGGLGTGLILSGLSLLIMAFILFLCERGTIKLFSLPASRFLLIIILFQILLGSLYITLVDYVPDRDFEWYHRQATNLASGSGIVSSAGQPTAYWPIGYLLILAPFYRVFGADVFFAQSLNLIIIAGITLFTYLLGRGLFGEKTARRAALILVFVPSQTFFAIIPMADILFSLLVIAILYLAIRRESVLCTILLGLIFGFAALTKPIILFFPFLLAVYYVLRGRKWKPVMSQLILILLIGEVILLPWQIRNYIAFGEFVPFSTNGGLQIWMGNNPQASGSYLAPDSYIPAETQEWMRTLSEPDRDRFSSQQGMSWALNHPLKAVLLWPKKFVHLYYKDSKCITYGLHASYDKIAPAVLMAMILLTEGYYYALGISFLIAIVLFLRREKITARVWLIGGTILYFTAIHLPFVTEGRYHMPLIPLFALGAALSIDHLKGKRQFQKICDGRAEHVPDRQPAIALDTNQAPLEI